MRKYGAQVTGDKLYIDGSPDDVNAKFSFYFPPREEFQGRFFQNTHQLLTSENGPPSNIGFAIASGTVNSS